jgi:hypothetical protein
MSNSTIVANLLRLIGLFCLQVLVFKQVGTAIGLYFNVLIYPLFLLLLPIRSATVVNIFIGFFFGLMIDWSYGGVGLHASAGVFGGFIRNTVIEFFAPKGGFPEKVPIASPRHISMQVFLSIASVFFALYLLWFFTVDELALASYVTIILKTTAAWILSMFFVWMYVLFLDPEQ